MSVKKLDAFVSQKTADIIEKGLSKGVEKIIAAVKPPSSKKGPRYLIDGCGNKEFLRMNSNSYLGLSLNKEVINAEEAAAIEFGAGPGAVRFISGTYRPHVSLEKKLATFHKREAAILFSAAYAAIVGVITSIVDQDTVVISDELNHNSIINAVRLSKPKDKTIYTHLDMEELKRKIAQFVGKCRHVLVITDGIFSMRGDYAPLDHLSKIAQQYDSQFEHGVTTLVDDSHGVGAIGKTGRGTEEFTNAKGIDLIVATLGKSFGINGGYLVGSKSIVAYLRETAPFYIYSNPITPSEASAAIKAVDILESEYGKSLLTKLRDLTQRFENGLTGLGFEILESEHPIVPLMVRNTKKTAALVQFLFDNGILATGLNYPVVPKGDEEIRFQVSADHTKYDIDYVLEVLGKFKKHL
jgi:glycine C-acetyltransferase